MTDRNIVLTVGPLRLRLYTGSTADTRRVFVWRFTGVAGRRHRGITARYRGEQCVGAQLTEVVK